MQMQSLCHARQAIPLLGAIALYTFSPLALGDQDAHDYPTHARVEYVLECTAKVGSKLASLYQCSCVIDMIAERLTYDEYVESSTYSRYASLAGERGGLFRDPESGRKMAKDFQALESEASKACGLVQ